MKKLIPLLIVGVILFEITLLVSCKSSTSDGIIAGNDNVFIDGRPLYQIQQNWKTKCIEKRILAKLKKLHNETQRTSQGQKETSIKFIEFVSITCMTFGNDTLKYIHSLRQFYNEDYLLLLYDIDTIIRSRLELIELLKGYTPKSKFEAQIIDRVIEYSPNVCKPYFSDHYDNLAFPLLKTLIIGPLNKGKIIYIKCFGIKNSLGKDEMNYFDIGVQRKNAPKGGYYKLFIKPEEFKIPLEKRGNNIFSYDLKYRFPKTSLSKN